MNKHVSEFLYLNITSIIILSFGIRGKPQTFQKRTSVL